MTYFGDPPGPNRKTQLDSYQVDAGGPALNAARTAAALGDQVRLMTALGHGPIAHLIRQYVVGVTVIDVAPPDYSAPISTVFVNTHGNRAVASVNTGGFTPVAPAAHLGQPAAVLLDGYVDATQLARAARAVGIPVVLDGGSFKEITPRLLPHVTVAALSADFRAPSGAEPMQWCLDHGAEAVVVTHGPDPIHVRTATTEFEIPVPAVDVVDTLGAGDVFHGALAVALARSDNLPDAVAGAGVIAAESTRHVGALTWVAS